MDLLLLNAGLATVLALLVAAAVALVRRPAFVSRAWLLVLVKLLLPPLVFVPLVRPTPAAVPTLPTVLPVIESVTVPPTVAIPDEAPEEVASPILVAEDATVAQSVWSWPAVGLGVWLAGSGAYWALAVVRLTRFHRTVRTARDATAELADDMAEAARAMKVRWPVQVRWLDAAVSPFALGRSTVFLPRGLWATLSPAGRLSVLAHEFAHLARGDVWARRLELAAVGLYWWLPIAWWARRRRRRAEEACCDERVIRALPHLANDYASALVEAAAFVSRPLAVPLACGGAARGTELRRRVTMILTPTTEHRRPWTAAILLISLAALALPWRPGWADDPPPEPPTPPAIPTAPAPVAPPAKVRAVTSVASVARVAEDVQALRDEVELLEVQLELRDAELRGAKAKIELAKHELDLAAKLRQNGTGSETEYRRAATVVASTEAELMSTMARRKEAEIKLRQGKRRLDSRMAAAHEVTGVPIRPTTPAIASAPLAPAIPVPPIESPTPSPARSATGRMIRVPVTQAELERRIDQLQTELDELKRQLARTKSSEPQSRPK
ncbi:MAG: M56 family metallopeptidase [Gemmataceae bacterium]